MTGDGVRGVLAAADHIEARIVEAEKLRAALEEMMRLHQPILLPTAKAVYMLCDHCCFDDSGHQTQDCIDSHEHSFDGPACATAEIIARAGL
jgi:hypothetical protein